MADALHHRYVVGDEQAGQPLPRLQVEHQILYSAIKSQLVGI
jgi:hypothetical protein